MTVRIGALVVPRGLAQNLGSAKPGERMATARKRDANSLAWGSFWYQNQAPAPPKTDHWDAVRGCENRRWSLGSGLIALEYAAQN